MNVLLVGASGRIGRRIAAGLLDREHAVIGSLAAGPDTTLIEIDEFPDDLERSSLEPAGAGEYRTAAGKLVADSEGYVSMEDYTVASSMNSRMPRRPDPTGCRLLIMVPVAARECPTTARVCG